MKQIKILILMFGLLAGCASAPLPKQPYEGSRVPVNKTVPDEIKNGQVPGPSGRGAS